MLFSWLFASESSSRRHLYVFLSNWSLRWGHESEQLCGVRAIDGLLIISVSYRPFRSDNMGMGKTLSLGAALTSQFDGSEALEDVVKFFGGAPKMRRTTRARLMRCEAAFREPKPCRRRNQRMRRLQESHQPTEYYCLYSCLAQGSMRKRTANCFRRMRQCNAVRVASL